MESHLMIFHKKSLAKLSKGSDAKPKGLRQYAMSAGCNKKMRIG